MERNKRIIKRWLAFFMIMLALSGITAMPAEWELSIAVKFFDDNSSIGNWLNEIFYAVKDTARKYLIYSMGMTGWRLPILFWLFFYRPLQTRSKING